MSAEMYRNILAQAKIGKTGSREKRHVSPWAAWAASSNKPNPALRIWRNRTPFRIIKILCIAKDLISYQ